MINRELFFGKQNGFLQPRFDGEAANSVSRILLKRRRSFRPITATQDQLRHCRLSGLLWKHPQRPRGSKLRRRRFRGWVYKKKQETFWKASARLPNESQNVLNPWGFPIDVFLLTRLDSRNDFGTSMSKRDCEDQFCSLKKISQWISMSEPSKFVLAQIRDNFVPTNEQNRVTQRRA